MTRAEIDALRRAQAETTHYLRETCRLLREVAEHAGTVADHLQEIRVRTDRAITARLTHLHGEDDDA